MLRPFTTICLTAAAIVVIGAYLLAQSGRQPGAAPSAPLVLAMQEPSATAQEKPPTSPLANAGWIGLMLEDNNGHGVRVASVFPGGPAAFAGVRAGDDLLKVGSTNIDSRNAAETAIEGLVPKRATSVTVHRHGKAVELRITPKSLAEFRERYISEMLRRDPRDPKYGERHGVSEADMHVELVRRLFEQHQRLETTLIELTKEIQALRKEVRALQK